jgi:phenylalanyl-tRNA synthetase beta chain
MKVSRVWLQTYFDKQLPRAESIADALTFHAFEIEEVTGDLIDVKVLPNRAADCLSHRGIAKELSAILDTPMKSDPLREPVPVSEKTALSVEIEDPKKCLRYMGALVKGVKIGPSPQWLKAAIESVGQRSINNVVDATNYVMLNIGQPLHAFDAARLRQKDGTYAIGVRSAKENEKITTLSREEFTLDSSIVVITDANADEAIALAGVKGGASAEVTAQTTDLVIESANFDGTTVRRAAQKLKLFTDASVRFQNRPSPELAAYGMRDVLKLITDIAGGETVGVTDIYPARPAFASVSVTLSQVNGILGSSFSANDVADAFERLTLQTKIDGDTFTVTPSFERTDLTIPEDLVEEVGRIISYDKVPAAELPSLSTSPDQARYRGIERMKDQLIEHGFTEVSTQSFAKEGDIVLENPLDKAKPALRVSLEENLQEALTKAKQYAPGEKPKLFEVGTVFPKEGEHLELRMTERVAEWGDTAATVDDLSVAKLEDYGKDYTPRRYKLDAYKPFSVYPFIARDIALWVPSGTGAPEIESAIRERAGELLIRLDQFDRFEKEGRVSYAFRLVFQSDERTLTDDEANRTMDTIGAALSEKGYEVR